MIPVRVKVLSSSSCNLSQASSLLQRFLSGDACSDSLARDYVANVAQALQDSISWRAGESGASLNKHRHFPSSSSHLSSPSSKELVDGKQSISATEQPTPSSAHAKLHGHEKQRSHSGKNNNGKPNSIDDGKAAGSAIAEAENAHKRHKKKRRYSAIGNGTETVSASMQEADDSSIVHRDKKRRKKEKAERETEHIATENSTPDTQKSRKKEKSERVIEFIGMENVTPDNQKRRKKEKNDKQGEHIATENVTPDNQKRRKKEKSDREGEHIATENVTPDNKKRRKEEKNDREGEHIATEKVTPDNQKKRKKEKHDREEEHIVAENVIPDKEGHHEKKKRKDKREAENNSIELASPAPNDQKSYEKKKRKKEKQDPDAENIETLHVVEFASPPTSILFDESLVMKSAVTEKKKRGARSPDANRITESGVYVTPLSPSVNKKEGSSKRKRKEAAGVLVTPDKSITVKTDVEAFPVNCENFDSEEKKRKKKKRTREEEPKFD